MPGQTRLDSRIPGEHPLKEEVETILRNELAGRSWACKVDVAGATGWILEFTCTDKVPARERFILVLKPDRFNAREFRAMVRAGMTG